ncbi:metal-dependent hydrolase [uncultured Hoeflea sp.]|uniref:metal-dependent hydrolase n=1 Tax=uncultured Hoeflea sp. TaxID=538666 RepID=UPI00261FD573|nr:metal-dependent hydrolase [uncultured Hoeflea sp.]
MKITWLGHSAFRLETAKATVLIDPFFTGNPGFEGNDRKDAIKDVSHILLTHGHGDHVGDTAEIAKQTGAVVLANYDLAMWLGHHHGLDKLEPGNTGGTISLGGFSATFVNALHSSAHITEDGVSHSLGNANGLMLHFEDEPSLLHMGDTDIFSDMALINELHRPEIGIVPIGDRFTMGGAVAALACRRFFSFSKVLPCHYGSFPIIEQTADGFLEAMEEDAATVAVPKSGGSIEV